MKCSTAIWIGLDGCTYPVILQAGIWVTANADGSATYSPWYQWLPDNAIVLSQPAFSLKGGDAISVDVIATNTTYGNIVFRNLATGDAAIGFVSAPDPKSVLGGQTAEWIVEDYEVGTALVSFTNFGCVHFTDSFAETDKGSQVGVDTGDTIELVANNKVITQVSMPGLGEVVVTYYG